MVWGKRADTIVHEDEPFNAEPDLEALAADELTPLDSFYSRNHGPIPDEGDAPARVRVTGLVDRELSLSVADLRERFDPSTVVATLQCAGNRRQGLLPVRDIPGEAPWRGGATGNARWRGTRLADVLLAAGVRGGARHVAFVAPDVSQLASPPQGYGSSIPLSKALSHEVLLAWEMNDAPLTRVHGAPLRVVVPGFIGARSVKWVQEISVQREPSDNFFQATAYRVLPPDADPDQAGPGDGISLGSVALNCEILQPRTGSHLAAGKVQVSGYALAGEGRTVERIDVSVDGGHTWHQADLDDQPSPWAWRRWRIGCTLGAGSADVVARAWDSTGAVQPELPDHVWNPKGYVNNSWAHANYRVT